MANNNNRPKRWWNSVPKIIDGKFLVVAILPDGEETTNLFTLEELATHITQRSADEVPAWLCDCGVKHLKVYYGFTCVCGAVLRR